ncbi:hypothetical protein BHE74_00050044 [Ensete ventricosum]|nr:hypothetical protein BHE74_00050044 [Ensete ventricosum]
MVVFGARGFFGLRSVILRQNTRVARDFGSVHIIQSESRAAPCLHGLRARTESALRVVDPVRVVLRSVNTDLKAQMTLELRGCAVSRSRLARVPLGYRGFRSLYPREGGEGELPFHLSRRLLSSRHPALGAPSKQPIKRRTSMTSVGTHITLANNPKSLLFSSRLCPHPEISRAL